MARRGAFRYVFGDIEFCINRPPFLSTYVLMLDFVSFLAVVPLRFDVKYHG